MFFFSNGDNQVRKRIEVVSPILLKINFFSQKLLQLCFNSHKFPEYPHARLSAKLALCKELINNANLLC
jgi:hypothetical protein